jgi:hypothetical protein
VEHLISFEGNEIQVKQHLCHPESIISYDETVLDDEDMVWIGSLTATQAPDTNELKKLVPEEYHEFMELFREPLTQELPPHQTFDYQIQIKEGKEVPFGPIYHLSEKELGALREYLDCILAQGKITESDANMGAPIIFIPKPNGKLRLYVNYRGLNMVTIKDPYPLPFMDELRDRVVGCEWFTKLNLRNGYYLTRLKDEESENAMTMHTHYGNFKYKVMPFGLVNAPATFQRMMNTILRPLLDQGVVVYLNDILIYTKTMEEHYKLVTQVFSILQREGLAVAANESFFHV